ncbi:hypothetical protein U0070_001590 [Myodes glareolus]|uniref:Uncharacterized protein n=1 Tax=Myodes glareolus TaxID=447135 RepID=A0AAW0IVW7_MYOGA
MDGEKPKLKLNLMQTRTGKPKLELTWSSGLLRAGSRRSLAGVLLRPLSSGRTKKEESKNTANTVVEH